MLDQRRGLEDDLRPRVDRAPGEVGVVAHVAGETLGVEAADALEQLARVEDVAGLHVRVGPGDHERAGERPLERPDLREVGGPRVGAALDDRPRVRPRGGEPVLEPAGGGDAIVVGEREQARAGGVPALLAGDGEAAVLVAAYHAQVEAAALELAGEHVGGVVGGTVVDDQDLEALAGKALGPQPFE